MTHVFTFAAGIALLIGVLAWRALTAPGGPRSGAWRRLAIALPALAVLAIEMTSGGPGTGSVLPGDPWDALRGLVIGDFVVSASALDVVGGAIVMAAVWIVAATRWRAVRRGGLPALAGEEVFGLALLVLSLVAPHGVGEGSYIPIRMRYLGAVALVPAIVRAAAALRPAHLAVPAAALFAALTLHTVVLDRDARRVHRDVALIDRLFAGVPEGSWAVTRLTMYRRGLFHVAGYRHILGRVAVPRRLVVLDNYEALYGVFSTVWRGTPDWIQFRPSRSGLTLRLVPGAIRWEGGIVFVLHESDRVLQVADPRLALGRSAVAQGGAFAVTAVRRLD